ncbi:MAG TPA: acyclic terpene utilization AtuA family protein [Planctomycetota bacterium]|nr:acyclic terpene utilization AtuA family protein [Planctomycetota bacterium]
MTRPPILVANGQGFWGDSPLGPVRLVREGPLHYLTLDYLAEVTMSILQKQKRRDPEKGYATDFIRMLERVLPTCMEKGIRIVANAGGVNPEACRRAAAEVVKKLKLRGVKIAVLRGDDILAELPSLLASGEELKNMDTGEPLSTVLDRVESANAYIGAFPIAEALAQGAHVVIAGRCTDPALVGGPLVHEFGWKPGDHDKLAAATVAGHIVECGPQCTGGNFSEWREVPDLARVGYPIAECNPDGTFVITKHPGTGGLVDVRTVASQLLYEMGDPRRYVGPDVVSDFTSIRLAQDGKDRVKVTGIRGAPPTDTYKVSIAYRNGWKAQGQLTVSGPDAIAKAKLCADVVFDRLALDGVKFAPDERLVELVGAGVCHEGIVAPGEPTEVVLRIGVKSQDEKKVARFGYELAPLVTSGPPGVTGFAGGRPAPAEIIAYWPALISKKRVRTDVDVEEIAA